MRVTARRTTETALNCEMVNAIREVLGKDPLYRETGEYVGGRHHRDAELEVRRFYVVYPERVL